MANEKRLIDAEAIARKLKNAHCAECNIVRQIQCSACWVNDVLELLDGDSVDAVEVVHGKWVRRIVDWSAPYSWKVECSNCDFDICGLGDAVLFKYCPNCGAKMDGGDADV